VRTSLTDPVTLTFDLSIAKPYNFYDIRRSFHTPSLNTLGSFVFELCCGETDRQTNKQTHSNIYPHRPTSVGSDWPSAPHRTVRINT